MRFWRRHKHVHDWFCVGYGGAGWHLYHCRGCDETEIA